MNRADYDQYRHPLIRKADYALYLQTPHWLDLKAKVAARSGGICETDGCGKRAREVHHKVYRKRFDEQLDDLIHLCGSCHRAQHKDEKPASTKPDKTCRRCGHKVGRRKWKCPKCRKKLPRRERPTCPKCRKKIRWPETLAEHLFTAHRIERGMADWGNDMKDERKRIEIEWDRRTFATVVKDTRRKVAEQAAKKERRAAFSAR